MSGRSFAIPSLLAALLTAAVGCPKFDEVPEERDAGAPETDVAERSDAPTSELDGSDAADAGPPPHDDAACRSNVVPTRFGYRWRDLNHRVSKWNTRLSADESPCPPAHLDYTVVGGPFSDRDFDDKPTAKIGFRRIDAAESTHVGTALRRVDATVGADGVAEGTASYERDAVDLADYGSVVPVVAGFAVDTDTEQPDGYPEDYNPAHGYTIRAFGASVATASIDEERLEIDYRFEFQPAASPDRPQMNDALEHARIDARLDILLIGTSRRRIHRGTTSYETTFPVPETGTDDDFDHAPEEDQRITLEGTPNLPAGVFGFQSFHFDLATQLDCLGGDDCPAGESCNEDGTCTRKYGRPGFYVRELGVDVQLDDYDPTSGRADFSADGFVSNATRLIGFYSLESSFEGRIAWFQVPGAGPTVRASRTFDTGATEWHLDSFD